MWTIIVHGYRTTRTIRNIFIKKKEIKFMEIKHVETLKINISTETLFLVWEREKYKSFLCCFFCYKNIIGGVELHTMCVWYMIMLQFHPWLNSSPYLIQGKWGRGIYNHSKKVHDYKIYILGHIYSLFIHVFWVCFFNLFSTFKCVQ